MGAFKDRRGVISYNLQGLRMFIVDYIGANNIVVEFDNGYRTKTQYAHFKNGKVKNLYEKRVFNVGYLGEGQHNASLKGDNSHTYTVWHGIIRRCYDSKARYKSPNYIGCSVCEEWHNFQNFAKWFDENFYQLENFKMHLDKDILVKGDKIYSPETCLIVPQFINNLFVKSDKSRGDFPIGVCKLNNRRIIKYMARCSDGKNKQKIGTFDTPEEAFQTYKNFKEKTIKEIAEKYKLQIPEKLYNALINYEVEITD